MADPTTLDLSQIISSSLKTSESSPVQNISVGGSNKPDLDKLTEISQQFTGAMAAQSAVQKNLQGVERSIAEMRQANIGAELTAQKAAEPAILATTKAEAEANLKTQQENLAFKTTAGLNALAPDSVLNKSIEEINLAHDRAKELLNAAEIRQSATFGDVLSGKTSFGTFFHDKVIDPAAKYTELAKSELAIAKNESDRIADLQSKYLGQAQVNSSSAERLTTNAVSDSLAIKSAELARTSGALQEHAMAIGAESTKAAMQESQHKEIAAHNQATLDVSIENSKRQWESLGLKTPDPAVLAGYIRVGLKVIGRPDADTYTAERVKEMMKVGTPEIKKFIQDFAASGSQAVGHNAMTPNDPLPALFGSPGQVQKILEDYRGKLPTGTEQFQQQLAVLSIGMDKQADGTLVKPEQRIANINAAAANWIETSVKRDTDNSPYGKPHLPTIVSMASMNTPEIKDFTQQVLKPLAISNETLDGKLILSAAFGSTLPQNKIIAGLVAYKRATAALVDSTRNPQLLGLPSAASLPYTVNAPTGSLFGTHQKIDIGSEKDLADYFLRKTLYKKAMQNSTTLIGAAASSTMIGLGAKP